MYFSRNIGLLLVILVPMVSIAQVVMTPSPSALDEEHLAILKQGVGVWNQWRKDNPNVVPNLSGATLSGFRLSNVDLSKATLWSTDLSGAILSRASLAGADLSNVDLSGALLGEADLTGANLTSANLSGADLFRTDLSRANLFGANLIEAKLGGGNLSGANLQGADMRAANLVGAELKNSNLKFAKLDAAIFELGSVPRARDMLGATGLKDLRVRFLETNDGSPAYDVGALIELREDAKSVGMRTVERDLTCSIERMRNDDPSRPWYVQVFYALAFDFTSSYGAAPQKPFWILLWVFFLGGFVHMGLLMLPRGGSLFVDFRLKYKDQFATIRLDWTPNGYYPKMSPMPSRLNRYPKVFPNRYLVKFKRGPLSKPRILLRLIGRVVRIGMYFSLLSTFNIGYREFNVGSWIGRLQKRQYTLRARGWLRVVSGAQSLLGVYLLALWILCTFGQPFG